VLARNWRRFSEAQRGEFLTEFRRHLSLTYGQSVEGYADESIRVERTRAEGNGDVTVRTKIVGAAADPILVDYRLRSRAERWLVIDVIIEGVSLISNFRTQTQEIISESGPAGLIERLRTRNQEAAAKG
jgi:phospholipid transport system substrate-binding protein